MFDRDNLQSWCARSNVTSLNYLNMQWQVQLPLILLSSSPINRKSQSEAEACYHPFPSGQEL
jgi:hypothetical protein